MDHSELIQEMVLLEKMTAQDRLKHARRRRQQQLKNWIQRETTTSNGNLTKPSTKKFAVKFPENVVLLEATARQDVDEVRQLLQTGQFNPNTANEDGLTPIHQCSIDNSEKLLKLLIEYGGDVNAKDRDLWTPLHAAATCGHKQICQILIENGAELLALNADGNMPYDICDDELTLDYIETQMDRIGITQEMIDQTRGQVENQMLNDLQSLVKKKSQTSNRSIDDILSYRTDEGATPLHIACANGYQTVVDYLLKQNVPINSQDGDGWTPIHAAAFWCQQPVIIQLIDAGADIYEKIPDGRSALELCDDLELRTVMIEYREQSLRNREKAAAAAAAAAAAQLQQKTSNRIQSNSNSLPPSVAARPGTLYESRSSVSSPYGSGSSLNRSSSIRRASIRDREKAKKLNENFLHVLEAKEQIQEDNDEATSNMPIVPPAANKNPSKEEQTSSVTTATDSTVREPSSQTSTKKNAAPIVEVTLPPLKVPPPLPPPPPPVPITADTLSDVKRRREERRRGIGASTSTLPPPSMPLNDNNNNNLNPKISNGIHSSSTSAEPIQRYTSPKQIEIKDYHVTDDDREKRICCTIL